MVSLGQDVAPDQPVMRWQANRNAVDGSSWQTGARRIVPPSGPRGIEVIQEVIPAGLHGRVVEITSRGGVVIESHATLIHGVIGAGQQVAGVLTLWRSSADAQAISPGAILVVPGVLTFAFLQQALASGVVGIIAGSMALPDLEGFLHVDLLALLHEQRSAQRQLQESFPSLTLLLTNGIGNAPMANHLFETLARYQGSIVLVAGETSFRYGIVPELIISLPLNSDRPTAPLTQPDARLVPGAIVRVQGGEQPGITATLEHLFAYAHRFSSDLLAPAALVRLPNQSTLIVPLFSLERIG